MFHDEAMAQKVFCISVKHPEKDHEYFPMWLKDIVRKTFTTHLFLSFLFPPFPPLCLIREQLKQVS